MLQPPDDDTQRLLRLLALKRHELPPPGFFDRLPARVLVSIRAGTEVPERSLWQALIAIIRGEPIIAGSYAALGIGALLFGVSVFQMAVDSGSDTPALAEGGMPAPGATAVPGMFLAGTSADPSAPTPPMPAGITYRIAAPVGAPFAHRGAAFPSGVYSASAYDAAAVAATAYPWPSDPRMDPQSRLVPVHFVVPASSR